MLRKLATNKIMKHNDLMFGPFFGGKDIIGFDSLFNDMMPTHEFKPCKHDITEYDDRVEIKAELPGYAKENISIKLVGDVLKLTAEKKEEKEDKEKGTVIRKEIYSGSISRSYPTNGMDVQNIKATFEDGILTINMPKIKTASEKSSEIKID